jgi:uncharacterized OsmC-like protein
VDAGTETVTFDGSWAQEPTGLPGPADLLASAFAACLLKNTERASQLLPFQYDGAEVDVVVRRQDNPPKFTEIACAIDGRIVAIPSGASRLTHPIDTAGPTAT